MSGETLHLASAAPPAAAFAADVAAPASFAAAVPVELATSLADVPAGLPASSGRRRALAVALLAAVLGFGWLALVGPLVDDLLDRHERETRQTALLQRLEPLRAEAPMLRRQLDALDAELAGPELLLRAASANQAAALLQTMLRRLLDAEGLAADQFQALPALPEGALTRVAVRIELHATLEQLHALLRAVAAHRPLLAVGDALVATNRGQGAAVAAPLTLRLDIRALSRVVPGDG
jgi:Tfp pilus assembly protein PilO